MMMGTNNNNNIDVEKIMDTLQEWVRTQEHLPQYLGNKGHPFIDKDKAKGFNLFPFHSIYRKTSALEVLLFKRVRFRTS